MTLQNKTKKQSKQKNQTQPLPTVTQLKQLRRGRRVQNSEVNYYSYKMKGVWSLGSATIYICTIITNSQCVPVYKKKNSALIQIFLCKSLFSYSTWSAAQLLFKGQDPLQCVPTLSLMWLFTYFNVLPALLTNNTIILLMYKISIF